MWPWFIINSDIFGCDWRKTGEDDVFEQVIIRKDKDPGLQGFFYTFPDAQEYSTKDLYRRHPTLPNHWLYQGRADDVIVFSNGEKLNPVTIESTIMGHPDVKGALVVGSNKFQPALLIEPQKMPGTEKEINEFIDNIWPLVVQANNETVAHGQIGRKFIAISKPDKTFLRAGKGTVQRAGTVKLYKDEIDDIYDKAGQASVSEAVKLDLSSEEGLTNSVAGLFKANAQDVSLDPDTDFFQAGIDSMQVINASRLLRASLEAAGFDVSAGDVATRVIYGNPTPRKLAGYLYSLVKRGSRGQEVEDDAQHEISAMKAQLDKYTRHLPIADITEKLPPADDGQVIMLTGSTGALGSYLLDFMCSSVAVKRIICLNRAEDGLGRQREVTTSRGLKTDFDKVEFLHANLGQSCLGVGNEAYRRLQNEVDRIIHNQWPVNFNMPVESFEPHVRGVRHLVDFSAGARKHVPVTFISSIGTVDGWKHPYPVPEESIDDLTIISTGYGRSKLVSSLLLEEATKKSGVPSEIIRVGQIGGPESENGMWNKQEWLPTIIASSAYLGVLPEDLGSMQTVDWTPIEGIAKMVLEVSGITSRVPIEEVNGYFHGVNPSKTSWTPLAQAVKEFYGGRIKRLVPFSEWVDTVEKSHAKTDDANKNPAVKLLDTYREMSKGGQRHVNMDMTRTKKYSKTMREMKAVTPDLMKHWCSQWGF